MPEFLDDLQVIFNYLYLPVYLRKIILALFFFAWKKKYTRCSMEKREESNRIFYGINIEEHI